MKAPMAKFLTIMVFLFLGAIVAADQVGSTGPGHIDVAVTTNVPGINATVGTLDTADTKDQACPNGWCTACNLPRGTCTFYSVLDLDREHISVYGYSWSCALLGYMTNAPTAPNKIDLWSALPWTMVIKNLRYDPTLEYAGAFYQSKCGVQFSRWHCAVQFRC